MLKGIQGQNSTFLTDLNKIENRISANNKAITSGNRINQASDDPASISALLSYQSQIDHLNQVQTNLALANTQATTADGVLQNAATILDQLTSIAAQGASDTSSADTRATLGDQVKQIQQQLVALANTSVNGRYVFGGDTPEVAPYTYSATAAGGVIQNSTAGATSLLQDASGSSINPGLTAAQIFDSSSGGTPSADNIFQAVYNLGQALASNDTTGIKAASDAIKLGATHLNQAASQYGNTENWISQATDAVSNQLTQVQTLLSSVRETDLPTAITQMTTDQTAMQAALAAHASLSNKSLFDYFG